MPEARARQRAIPILDDDRAKTPNPDSGVSPTAIAYGRRVGSIGSKSSYIGM